MKVIQKGHTVILKETEASLVEFIEKNYQSMQDF